MSRSPHSTSPSVIPPSFFLDSAPASTHAPASTSSLVEEARALFIDSAADLMRRFGSARFYMRLWTPTLTLFAMVIGALVHRASLSRVTSLMATNIANGLPLAGKLASSLAFCKSTAGFASARARLPLTWLRHCFTRQAQRLHASAIPKIPDLCGLSFIIRVLDGTMINLRSVGSIARAFPPHSNQHGATYWCQMRVLVCMCLSTGLVLSLVVGNKYDSELAQTVRLILFGFKDYPAVALSAPVLWLGDANFGVWAVAAAARQMNQHCLVRMTPSRARKVLGRNLPSHDFDLRVEWCPTRHDSGRHVQRRAVAGRLICRHIHRPGFRVQTLLLFTTVDEAVATSAQLVELYAARWRIELSLRHLKTQMGMELIEVKSPAMAKRELIVALMAYNLVRAVMLKSGATYEIDVWRLSFSKARDELVCFIVAQFAGASTLEMALWRIANGKLPKRRKPRPAEPRAKRHRRETFPPLRGDRRLSRQKLNPSDNPSSKS